MATEGGHAGEYDPSIRPKLLGEVVRLVRAFSFAGTHVVIVGGLVPSLLVPKPEARIEPHVGTQDLDLCLRVALVEGDVGNYDRLENCLKETAFAMVREAGRSMSWRWRGGVDLPLTVEFFCPPGPGREIGRLHRPGGVVGGKLSAMVLATGELIDRDFEEREVEVLLPAEGGLTRHSLRVAGPAAYLAAKVDALCRRNKNKDAYDIVWLAEAWPGGPVALAEVIRSSSVYTDSLFEEALDSLAQEFNGIDSAGAVKYARFTSERLGDRDFLARRASGAIGELLRCLGRKPA